MTADAPITSILLIEDEKPYGEIVEQLHACVSKSFYDKCTLSFVTSWQDGMASIAAKRPDAVVLDLGLPPLQPDDTLRLLAATWKTLPPVVVLTGNEDPTMRRKSILAGAASFQAKLDFNRHPELLCEKIYEAFLRRLRDEGA